MAGANSLVRSPTGDIDDSSRGRPDPHLTESLCPPCGEVLRAKMESHYCGRCGAATGPFSGGVQGCALCRLRNVPWDGVVRAAEYATAVSTLILCYKASGDPAAEAFFKRLLAREAARASWRGEITHVVPVPTHWLRRAGRQADLAQELALAVARELKAPLLRALRATHNPAPQKGLSRTQREENLKGAFRVVRAGRVSGTVPLLVDDVLTTGTTAALCTRLLKRAGATRVYVAVVAKTPPPMV